MNKPDTSRLFRSAAILLVSTFPALSFGAGFAIVEQSVSGLGNSYAGGAAVAEDASSVFYNPAGLTRLTGPSLNAGVHFIRPRAEYTDSGSSNMMTPAVPTQGPNASTEEDAFVPNLYYAHPISDRWTLAIGVYAPYGLVSEYDDGWVGRYIGLKSELQTLFVTPSVAWKITDRLSIGAGISYVAADAELSSAIDFGLAALSGLSSGQIPSGAIPPGTVGDIQASLGTDKYDGRFVLEGDDESWGWNVGLLYEFSESTRLGVVYRSEVETTLSGSADFDVGLLEPVFGGRYHDQGGSADLDLPATAQISLYHDLTDRFAIMADVMYTWWSSFDELRIQYSEGQLADTVIPEKWDDVWRFSLGANWLVNEDFKLRVGVAYDESPVPGERYLSPRIPDADRTWVSLGFSWYVTEKFTFDLAYVHIFVDDATVSNDTHTTGHVLRGSFDSKVDILSLGGSYTF